MDLKLNITYDTKLPIQIFRWTPTAYRKPLHTHASLEIGCCLQGEGRFYFGDKIYPVRPGDIFIVNHIEPHIAESNPHDPSLYLFLNFDADLLRRENLQLLLPFVYRPEQFENRLPADTEVAKRIRGLMEKLYAEWTSRMNEYETMSKCLLLELCVELVRHRFEGAAPQDWEQLSGEVARLQPALDWMSAHYTEPVALRDIADLLGVRPETAMKWFRRATGRSWGSHLTEHRLLEARRLLAETGLSVADVAFQSGFQSMPSFYRLFQKHVGVPPSAYRATHQRLDAGFES